MEEELDQKYNKTVSENQGRGIFETQIIICFLLRV